jgi:hypothetical protein
MRYLLILLLFVSFNANATRRYWIGGGTNANWSASPTTNWAATDGGTTRVAAPISTDSVYFTGTGVTANSNSSIANTQIVAFLFIGSGYSSQLNFATGLTVNGDITFGANMTFGSGTSSLSIAAAATMTSNGKTFPNTLSLSTGTKTLVDNWTANSLTFTTVAINGNTLSTLTNLVTTNTTTISGTTVLQMIGTGTLHNSGNVFSIQTSLTFNTSGTITLGSSSGALNLGDATGATTPTITYTSGTIVGGSNPITFNSGIYNTNGMSWGNLVTFAATSTIRLNSLLTCTRQATLASGNLTFTGTGGFNIDTLNLNHTTATGTITLDSAATYTVNKQFNCYTSRIGVAPLITSSGSANRTKLNLTQGCVPNILANFTRVNASKNTIWTFNGTITDCLNVKSFNDQNTIGNTFVQ